MSLRIQLVLLFTAVLAGTLLVATALGLRIGQRSVEDEIRKRTAELASATTLALKHAGTDDEQLSEELAGTMRMHRGLLRAELARQASLGVALPRDRVLDPARAHPHPARLGAFRSDARSGGRAARCHRPCRGRRRALLPGPRVQPDAHANPRIQCGINPQDRGSHGGIDPQ